MPPYWWEHAAMQKNEIGVQVEAVQQTLVMQLPCALMDSLNTVIDGRVGVSDALR